jgi:hypothetical protein
MPLFKRHECRCSRALDAAAGKFHAEWRSHVQLATNEGCFDFWTWVIYERAERQNANGRLHEVSVRTGGLITVCHRVAASLASPVFQA